MTAPPYMPLYVGDYLADTTHLDGVASGAYALLLLHMHQQGGSLPQDERTLAMLCKATSSQWAKMKGDVLAFFRPEKGRLVLRERFVCHIWQPPERRPYVPGWDRLRAAVIERDGLRCRYCGDDNGPFEADHIVPVARGGKDVLENLACACRACNRSKGAKLLSEWVR